MKPRLWALLFALIMMTTGRDAWAWGDEGHKVICEIAFRLVQASTGAEIQKLISNDQQFDNLQ